MGENEFEMHYQPIVNIGKGSMIGAEALLRASFRGELISPEWLFLSEQKPKDLFELDMLCHKYALQQYLENNNGNLLFLNIETSLIEFYLRQKEEILEKFDTYHIPRNCIVIEIKEKDVSDATLAYQIVKACKESGFLIALDDVGSGYSNLSRIVWAMPDIIKIDRTVVQDIDRSFYKQEILRSFGSLGQKIGAIIIAEGVERKEEAVACMLCGVEWLQGYYFEKAIPPAGIEPEEYIEKCKGVTALYQKEIMNQRQLIERKTQFQKNIFENLIKKLTNSVEKLQRTKVLEYLKLNRSIECVYVIDANGMQKTELILNPTLKKRKQKEVLLAQAGDIHLFTQYHASLILNLGTVYTSPRYISKLTGDFCHTMAAAVNGLNGIAIICADMQVDY